MQNIISKAQLLLPSHQLKYQYLFLWITLQETWAMSARLGISSLYGPVDALICAMNRIIKWLL